MQETKALISAMTGETRGGSRAAAPGCGFSRGATQQFDIVELLVKRFGFLETDNNSQLRFTHQYFRDYFCARHYVNLMEVITQCFDSRQIDDVQSLFDEWRLGHIWFAGEDADRKVGNPFQTKQGSRHCRPDQEGRKGSEEGVPENLRVPL